MCLVFRGNNEFAVTSHFLFSFLLMKMHLYSDMGTQPPRGESLKSYNWKQCPESCHKRRPGRRGMLSLRDLQCEVFSAGSVGGRILLEVIYHHAEPRLLAMEE